MYAIQGDASEKTRRLRLSKKPCRKFKNKKLHKAGKAPSGRELDFAKQKTEGECVNIKFDQNFK